MAKNLNEMTLDECCEELLVRLGWEPDAMFDRNGDPTLGNVAGALPEGWTVEIKQESQSAFPGVTWWCVNAFHMKHGFAAPANIPGVGKLSLHADTEIIARARLAVACHRAEKSP